jgi:uncharacterized protein
MYIEKNISPSMRERKKFACALELKSLDEHGRFAGYASVFNVVDSQRDVVLKGAFKDTVKGRVRDIKFLWQHQQDEPIGVLDTLFEDARGLYVEGRIMLSIHKGQEAYNLLKAGAISGLSIGYSPVKYIIDASTGVRRLSQVSLWEISLVTFPANDAASVTVVKSATTPSQLVALCDALDRAITSLSCP